ncbi:MAG TPA: NTF2-like N-terminal transpeptidase domain-containing protein, partial [Acidimicrobiia bacterium]|nr:NTF2-like N-terminal transpeptidase domain-containing protein [Acidimicrobiia bacterium]
MGLTFATKRRRRFLRWRTLVVLIVVAGIGAGAFVVLRKNGDSTPPLPSAEVDTFLRSWTAGDAAGMASELDLPPTDLARMATSLVHARRGSRASYTRTGLVRDAHNAKEATATYHGRVDVNGFGTVEWDGTFRLVRVKQDKKEVWRIQYQPDILYPGLRTGQYLDLQVTWPARASILAADGSVLAGTQSVITIGLEPARVTKSLNDIKRLMQQLVGTDPASIDAALHAPGVQPNWFVPIATVADDSRYTTVLRPQLYPLPGLSFRRAR